MAGDRDPQPKYRRYRAPQENHAALVEPAIAELPAMVASNSKERNLVGLLATIAGEARRDLVEKAYRFTRSFCEVPLPGPDAASQPLIVSGHQPELFHPGVWFKNFTLDRLAKAVDGIGVHLLIDSDLCRAVSLSTPTGSTESPRVESIAYDKRTDALPFEERGIVDPSLFVSFGQRVAVALDGWIERPLAVDLTPEFVKAARETERLAHTLSRGRRLVEQRHGSTTLEVPLSQLCDSIPFHRFVGVLLSDLDRLQQSYNKALAAYRVAHRLRSLAQPLPDLAIEDGWNEVPLWVWTTEDPVRRPLFARHADGCLELTNRAGERWEIHRPDDPAEWAGLRSQGVKLRSRALVTTLYARLALGDLFLHGIGGAKYDEVTDAFSHRLLGITPPPHATLTATLRLPVARPEFDPTADGRLRNALRALRYHPERYVSDPPPAAATHIEAKQAALRDASQNGIDALCHRRIEDANLALQPLLADQRQAILDERDTLANQRQVAAVLGSREYSFALFPEETICSELARLASVKRD